MTEKKHLRFNGTTEIRRSLAKVANMVLNHELDPKSANTIVYAANAILGTFNALELINEKGDKTMKTNRQFTIQQLLRAAEITGDGERRENYLDMADKLIREEIPKGAIEMARKEAGVDLEA